MARIDPSGAIEIQDEGTPLGAVTIINFAGADVEARPDGTARVTVHVPPSLPAYASHLGTTDGSTNGRMNWPATVPGRVSEPTTPGNPFDSFSSVGDWANPSADHPLDKNAGEAFTTLGRVTELDVGTTLRVRFYKYTSSGGGQVLLGEEFINCDGTNQLSTPNGYIQTTSVSLFSGRYEGLVGLNVPISTLLPFGGYLRAFVLHEGPGVGFPYSDTWEVFSDAYATPPVPFGMSVTEVSSVLKYLSGIRHYNTGSVFDVGGSVTDAFKAAYHVNPVLLDLSSIGVTSPASLAFNDPVIIPAHPPTPKYSDPLSWVKRVTVATPMRNLNAQPRSRAQDPWGISSYSTFTSGPLMIDSLAPTSSRLDELFDDEVYRLKTKATWPSVPTGGDVFDSSVPLDNTTREAQVAGGNLIYPVSNFLVPIGRLPAQQVGTDYSAMTGAREYQRSFQHDTSPDSRTNVVLYIPGFDENAGDISPAGSGSVNMQIYIPGVSPVWFDVGREYFSFLFPTPQPGCLVKSLSGIAGGFPTNEYWYCTFGPYSTTSIDRMIILWVTLRTTTMLIPRVLAFNWT